MSLALSDLRNAFEGIIPAVIATVDDAGMPNISYLSHVYFVDDSHVAVSNQFFSKTTANVRRNGAATVGIVDPCTGLQYLLELQFERAFDAGEVFDRISTHLDIMSSLRGLTGIMKLKTADIYRVLTVRAVHSGLPAEPPAPPACNRLGRAARVVAAIAAEEDSDAILDAALDGLYDAMQFRHAMVLLPDEDCKVLSTVGSRGYSPYGVGSEVTIGDGLIGMAAATKLPVRIADMGSAHRYVEAVDQDGAATQIPLPGLSHPHCQVCVPMLARGQLCGAIFVESEAPFAYTHEDEDALMVIAGQLATALLAAELKAQGAIAAETPPVVKPANCNEAFRFKYYAFDDSVFIDDDYVIKGVPGRLLYHFVSAYAETGRRDFSNRQIRREAALKLPDFKDNLETRLILLRRRLDEKGGPIRLTRPERGLIRVEIDACPSIEVVNA